MLYIIIKSFSLIIFKLIFRLKIIGRENIPKTGPFVIVANHSSLLDGFVLVSSVKPKITFMSAAYLFKMPFVGNILRGVGAIPVQGKGNDIKLIKNAMKVLQAGGVLGIFPEGRITNEKDDFSAKAGAAYLAVKADVPIIPMAIKGAGKALPVGAKFPKLNRIKVKIGKLISGSKKIKLNKKILEDTVNSYMKEIY
ncbi:MAG: 1-acyl-sn-glycerol-3-phosphate acyltransferase [bacterium]|uniref:lysophospholipid acyltransferase family protein n=1 Tax=Candidatus Infernicultor aquiphilus TaxID=1805029 RepID=UPI000AF847BF|nr:1-acyl-sn-glycerol-3-phosphate acyltransferase [bacterium]